MAARNIEKKEQMDHEWVIRELEKMYPRVKFTGQQPGEERVERDMKRETDDSGEEEPEDQREVARDGERLVSRKEPTHRIPRA